MQALEAALLAQAPLNPAPAAAPAAAPPAAPAAAADPAFVPNASANPDIASLGTRIPPVLITGKCDTCNVVSNCKCVDTVHQRRIGYALWLNHAKVDTRTDAGKARAQVVADFLGGANCDVTINTCCQPNLAQGAFVRAKIRAGQLGPNKSQDAFLATLEGGVHVFKPAPVGAGTKVMDWLARYARPAAGAAPAPPAAGNAAAAGAGAPGPGAGAGNAADRAPGPGAGALPAAVPGPGGPPAGDAPARDADTPPLHDLAIYDWDANSKSDELMAILDLLQALQVRPAQVAERATRIINVTSELGKRLAEVPSSNGSLALSLSRAQPTAAIQRHHLRDLGKYVQGRAIYFRFFLGAWLPDPFEIPVVPRGSTFSHKSLNIKGVSFKEQPGVGPPGTVDLSHDRLVQCFTGPVAELQQVIAAYGVAQDFPEIPWHTVTPEAMADLVRRLVGLANNYEKIFEARIPARIIFEKAQQIFEYVLGTWADTSVDNVMLTEKRDPVIISICQFAAPQVVVSAPSSPAAASPASLKRKKKKVADGPEGQRCLNWNRNQTSCAKDKILDGAPCPNNRVHICSVDGCNAVHRACDHAAALAQVN